MSGSPTAGENYTLECSADGSIARFEWLGPPDGRTPVANSGSIVISSNSITSQLQFRSLQQSHNGSYSCRAITDGETLLSEFIEISVNGNLIQIECIINVLIYFVFNISSAPKIAVQITSTSGDIAIAGEDYSLTCSVFGVENLNSVITYQWRKNDNSYLQVVTEKNSTIISFAPARMSDAETNNYYSCSVTIVSNYLTENVVIMTSQGVIIQSNFNYAVNVNVIIVIILIVPTPSFITLMSSKANTNQIIGSDITLTCVVKLNSSILDFEIFLLMVDVQLSKDGTKLALIGPTVTGTTFTYTTQLNSFGKSDFGNYTCTATIRPLPSLIYLTGTDILSDTLTITAGK